MRKQWLLLAASLALVAVPVFAQRSTATIRGTVTDPQKAVILGAKVSLKSEDTGALRSTTTNAAGLYSFADLPVGSYELSVEYTGFKSAVLKRIGLNVADVRALDVQLATGELTEQLTVEVPAVAVQTIGGDVSGLVTGEQVRELPLNGRNFLQLALLMPGVSAADFLNVKDKGLLGGSDISVSGSGVTSNMWTVDGANNNDVGSNRTILVYPSVDAIEEFKIHRNNYGAEFGQAAGAQINLVTRGGTNEFHGSTFYFGRRDALDSTNYFLEQAGKEKDKLERNDFGWSLGGPIIKDRLHFFAAQEWNKETRGSVRVANVPTALERQGDFSVPNPCGGGPAPVDPLTGLPFPGNRIPANRLSPGGQLLMQLLPPPNNTPGAGSCNNWIESLNSPINWRQENIRFDYTINDRTRVMARYTQDHWTNDSPNLFSNLWGDDPFPAVDSDWSQPGRSLILQLNQNIGSKATNSLSFSYSANSITVTRGGTQADLNSQLNAAIPSSFPDSLREYGADRGHPLFWGSFGYGYNLWNEAPFKNNQDLFVFKDDYSAVFKNHFVKAGALFSTNKKNEDSLGNGSNEAPQFWGSGAGLNGWGSTTGNNLANILLRDMTIGFSEFSGQRQVLQRWKDLEFYASDSWKVRSNVTLDYGLRYSLFFNSTSADGRVVSFDPNSFSAALGADACNGLLQPPGTTWCADAGYRGGTPGPNDSLYPQDNNNFAPRIGVAWDISGNGKTAIRAGVGRFFLRERLSPGLNIGNNPPFTVLATGIRKLDTAVEPCDGCIAIGGSPNSGREQRVATPNNWQWNVTFEKELFRNTVLELTYVGNKGQDLLRVWDVNGVAPGDTNRNGVEDRLDYARTGDASLRPYGVFGDHRIAFWDHSGHSMYHGLQTQIISHFGRGSQFQASYTYSKVLGNDPLDNSDGGLTQLSGVLDHYNPQQDYGRARTDRTHLFNASLVLVLPKNEDKSGFAKHVLGDWEVATIVEASSGIPLTVYAGGVPGLPGNNNGASGTGYADNTRPNRVPGVNCRASGGPKEQILNPAAYTMNGFRLGTIGDAGTGTCNGPDMMQVDLALYKNIKLNDRFKLQVRFEVFNVFNRVNFIGSNLNTGLGLQNVTFDTGDQATANAIQSATFAGGFGQATATRDPRQAQFGLKLIF